MSLPLSQQSSKSFALYTCAVVLPVLSTVITMHVRLLHALPFALSFITVAVLATIDGLGPALLAVVVALLSHEVALYLILRRWPVTWLDLLRGVVMLIVALLLSLMTKRRNHVKHRLESTLAALQERTGELIESQQASRCVSWKYDRRSGVSWQSGGYEVFGIPLAQLEKMPNPVPLVLPDDQSRVYEATRGMISTGSPLHIEFRVSWPNGELHWLEARGSVLAGAPGVWRGIILDITERKLAEAALVRAEKLAAMGRLASTVAHEVNNPLEAVTNLLYLARTDASLNPETQSYLATAERELARLADITRLTLGFVRTNLTPSTVVIADVIEDVLSIFRHRYQLKNISIERSFQRDVAIHIPQHELRQIVTNLVSNAIDALSLPGSLISIRVFAERDNLPPIAVIVVEDNGTGIDADHLTRIFDPFFSTKADVGTGIGLWVTRELAHKNGGVISVESGDLGGGMKTRFRVELPLFLHVTAMAATTSV